MLNVRSLQQWVTPSGTTVLLRVNEGRSVTANNVTGGVLCQLTHRSDVRAIVSTAGGLLVAGLRGGAVVSWDIKSGRQCWSTHDANASEEARHSRGVTCLAVVEAKKGRGGETEQLVVSGSEDSTVRAWSLATGEQRWSTHDANASEEARHSREVRCLAVVEAKKGRGGETEQLVVSGSSENAIPSWSEPE